METKKVKALVALQKLHHFLEPFLPIVNTHMVYFYTGKVWEKLNSGLKADLESLTHNQLTELPNNYLNIAVRKPSHIGPTLLQLMEDINMHNLKIYKILDSTTNKKNWLLGMLFWSCAM